MGETKDVILCRLLTSTCSSNSYQWMD